MTSSELRRKYFQANSRDFRNSVFITLLRNKQRALEPFDDDEYFWLATMVCLWSSITDFSSAKHDDLELLDRMLELYSFGAYLSVPWNFDEEELEAYEDHIESTFDRVLSNGCYQTKREILNREEEFDEHCGPGWSADLRCKIDEYGRGENSYRVHPLFQYFSSSLLDVAERVQKGYDSGSYG